MESGEIHSDQITASSQYSTNWSAERSRLNYPENGWTPGEDSYREWIQVPTRCGCRCGQVSIHMWIKCGHRCGQDMGVGVDKQAYMCG